MNPELIESFRENFEKLSAQRTELENQIKLEASKEISYLISQNKFESSQTAVSHLKALLGNIQLEMDFREVSDDIIAYNKKIEDLKSSSSHTKTDKPPAIQKKAMFSSHTPEGEYTKREEEIKNFATYSPADPSLPRMQDLVSFAKEHFQRHHYQVGKAHEDEIEVVKKRKKYWLTFANSSLSKEAYFKILNNKCERKNIGFVCDNDEEMTNLISIVNEWAQKTDPHNTKFLQVNFTSRKRLSESNSEIFKTTNF